MSCHSDTLQSLSRVTLWRRGKYVWLWLSTLWHDAKKIDRVLHNLKHQNQTFFCVGTHTILPKQNVCVCPNKTNHAMTCSSTTLMTALDFFLLKFFFDFFVTISHGCVTYFLCITTIHTTTTMTPISQRAAAAVCCCCFFFVVVVENNNRTKVEEGKKY